MRSMKRTLRRVVLLAAVAGVLTLRPPADARANDSLDWLEAEPVTLLDLGVIRLKQDLIQVGQQLIVKGVLPVAPTTGACYDWRERKVII
ncbi:MAG: hypothetical protein VW268_04500 [Rhodospirillaceae bacterium]